MKIRNIRYSVYNKCKLPNTSKSSRKGFENRSVVSTHQNRKYLYDKKIVLCFSGKKVFYITNEKLTLNKEHPSVKGCSSLNGITTIDSTQTLKRTLIHEYAHLSGLDHCNTYKCQLEIKGNGDELCSKCRNKIKIDNQVVSSGKLVVE